MSKDETRNLRAELAEIEKAIAAQESLRGKIPDETLDIILSPLRARHAVIAGQLPSVGAPTTVITGYVQADTITEGGQARGVNIERFNARGNVYMGGPPKDDADALRIYRQVLVSSCERLPLRGVDLGVSDPSAAAQRVSLAQVYINLDTKASLRARDLKRLLAGKPLPKGKARGTVPTATPEEALRREEVEPLPVLLATALNRQMVLLGDPGSGKTTFLRRLALCLAAHDLQPKAGWLQKLAGWPAQEGHLVPVVVLLRDFAQKVAQKGAKPKPQHLWDFIVGCLQEQNLGFAADALEDALNHGQALVLLDGLDEVPTAEQRTFVRNAVQAFMGRYEKTTTRFLVTCRTLSYQNPAWQLPEVPSFELAPFSAQKIEEFIRAWYDELGRSDVVRSTDAAGLAQALSQAVRRPDLWRLAPNPLLLTVMALVHTHKGHLPEARALLYEDTVDILLWRWEQIKPGAGPEPPRLRQLLLEVGRGEVDLKRVMGELAYQAHAGTKAGDTEGMADISGWALEQALAGLHPKKSKDWASDVTEQIKLRAGLLLERAPGVYTFPHRTFQEYLAGAHLSTQGDFARQAAALAQADDLWRQVIVLAAGRLVYLSGDMDKPLALTGELCPAEAQDTEMAWRQAWWAGEVLLEMGLNRVRDSALGRDLLPRVRLRLAELVDKGRLAPVERAAAGRALAQLDDPRRGVGCTPDGQPDIVWVEVPAGEFLMGEGEEQHPVTLPTFYISRYPVTNAQFAAFVRAGGYKEKRYWPEAETAEIWRRGAFKGRFDHKPRSAPVDSGSPFNLANHPVVNVTWYEALTFCRWLHDTFCRGVQLNAPTSPTIALWQQGEVVTHELAPEHWRLILPSEAEWEKAARGSDGREFPWGRKADPDKANYDRTGIGSTSAVGSFPAGQSPCDALDMAGNVWEWTRSIYGGYPYDPEDSRREDLSASQDVTRVLRGGAFYYAVRSLRCAFRYRHVPLYWAGLFGFRLVLSPIFSAL